MENQIELDETSDIISSNKVEGTSVYDSEGNNLGSIYNFMVNKRSGQVEYAALRFGGFWGSEATIIPSLGHADLRYRQGWLSSRYLEGFARERSALRREQRPVFDQSYGRDLYGYYGVPYSF
jgi:hypothetical protein